jgi:hypothetical protein
MPVSQPPDAPDPYLPPPQGPSQGPPQGPSQGPSQGPPQQPAQPFGQGYPQQGYPQQGYPQQPYPQPYPQHPYGSAAPGPYPGGSVEEVQRQRPSSVTRLVQVMFLGALVALLANAYALFTVDSALAEAGADLDALATESGGDPAQLVDLVTTFGVVAIVVSGLLTIGLWLLFGWLFSQGRGRVAGIVLGIVNGALSALAFLGSLLAVDPVDLLLQLLNLAVIVAGLVLLWRPATSAWFAAVAAARQRTAWS